MKAMNFYTQNGWAGSNYDSKLSTKEIAAKVRAYAKKNFPEFKFSIRSEWSMYTDSMYIELKAGTCIPFIEGSRSAQRGYLSTCSSVKAFKNELPPEVFAVLDAVTTYASSFRYDDSDGMQDYYDTNFYLSIKVSDEYRVIEPKVKKNAPKKGQEESANVAEPVTVEELEIVDYSEKAIAVFGDTKSIKEQLKEIGGRFNPSLNYNGEKRAGWIFSKKQTDKVRELLASAKIEEEPAEISPEAVEELPALPEEIYIPELAKETEQQGSEEAYPFENIHFTETDNKIEVGMLSVSSHYKPMVENVEAYEKEVKGKRYTVQDKPLTLGYYGVLDNLDNCIIECYPTKEEAEKEAERLNSFTDDNGRLKRAI